MTARYVCGLTSPSVPSFIRCLICSVHGTRKRRSWKTAKSQKRNTTTGDITTQRAKRSVPKQHSMLCDRAKRNRKCPLKLSVSTGIFQHLLNFLGSKSQYHDSIICRFEYRKVLNFKVFRPNFLLPPANSKHVLNNFVYVV